MTSFSASSFLLSSLLLLCLVLGSSASTKYYVSPTGSNSNSGTAQAPFQTISYAVSVASSSDYIMLLPGSYTEASTVVVAQKSLVIQSSESTVAIFSPLNNEAVFSFTGATNSYLAFVTISGSSSSTAGCLKVDDSTLNLQSVNLVSCSSSSDGGAVSMTNGGTLVAISTYFESSTAASGGAISAVDTGTASVSLTKCMLSANTASTGNGGAINIVGTLSVANSSFTANQAVQGGAIFLQLNDDSALDAGRSMSITASVFSMNAAARGGAVYVNNTNLLLSACTGTSNSATQSGGLVYSISGSLTIAAGLYVGNTAQQLGGAVYTDSLQQQSAGTTLTDVNFISNAAGQLGGTIFSSGPLKADSLNISFSNAINGSAVYINDGAASIHSSFIFTNYATLYGGGLYCQAGQTSMNEIGRAHV